MGKMPLSSLDLPRKLTSTALALLLVTSFVTMILPVPMIYSDSAFGELATSEAGDLLANSLAKMEGLELQSRLPFIQNEGQVNSDVRFYVDTFAGRVYVTNNGLTYDLVGPGSGMVATENFIHAKTLQPYGIDQNTAVVNHFVGEKSNWRTNIATFNGVSFGEVWDGIVVDLKAENNNVEKIFTLAPGANVHDIRIAMEGITKLQVGAYGELIFGSELGSASLTAPIAYQEINGEMRSVGVSYVVGESGQYGFVLGSDYNPNYSVVIDPLLASTYIGGSLDDGPSVLSTNNELAGKLTIDSAGNVFLASISLSGNYPTTSGAYQEADPTVIPFEFPNVVVSKFDSNLSTLLASTYLGGSAYDEAYGIAVDGSNNVFVIGKTNSSDFPTDPSSYDQTYHGSFDIFVSKLSNDLISLEASTYIGGSGLDDGRAIVVDSSDNIYLTGSTGSTDYPTMGAIEGDDGNLDAIVTKLDNDLSGLIASTYLGGSGIDEGHAIAMNGTGTGVLITGRTLSVNYPTISGAYDTSANGGQDAFVSLLNPDLGALTASTYLGGSGLDVANGIAVGFSHTVFIVGRTNSADFPTPGGYDTSHNGDYDAFVSRLDPHLDGLSSSTYIGSSSVDFAYDVAIGPLPFVYVATHAGLGYPTTSGAYDETHNGNNEAAISALHPNLGTLQASTFVGGLEVESPTSLAINSGGEVYLAGITSSSNFPTTSGSYDTSNNGNVDLFVSKFTADLAANAAYVIQSNNANGDCEEIGGTWSAPICTLATDFMLDSGDSLTVNSGATLNLVSSAIIDNSGSITNAGTITGNGAIDSDLSGIINTGGITVYVRIPDTVLSTSYSTTFPIQIQVGTTLTVNSGATLTVNPQPGAPQGDTALRVDGTLSNSGTISNAGLITGNSAIDSPLSGISNTGGIIVYVRIPDTTLSSNYATSFPVWVATGRTLDIDSGVTLQVNPQPDAPHGGTALRVDGGLNNLGTLSNAGLITGNSPIDSALSGITNTGSILVYVRIPSTIMSTPHSPNFPVWIDTGRMLRVDAGVTLTVNPQPGAPHGGTALRVDGTLLNLGTINNAGLITGNNAIDSNLFGITNTGSIIVYVRIIPTTLAASYSTNFPILVPVGINLTVESGATLTVNPQPNAPHGGTALRIDGTVIVRGTLNNLGLITGNGAINTDCGGSVTGSGTISGPSQADICAGTAYVIQSNNANGDCEEIGGTFSAPTCTLATSLTLGSDDSLTIDSGAILGVSGTGSVNNSGDIINSGTFNIFPAAVVINTGTITNSGTVGSCSNPGIIDSALSGIVNTGTICSFVFLPDGTTFSSDYTVTFPLRVANGRTMTIDPGVTFTLTSDSNSKLAVVNTGTTVNNGGTINNAGGIDVFSGSVLVNTGSIANSGTIGSISNPGVIDSALSGIVNTGSIHSNVRIPDGTTFSSDYTVTFPLLVALGRSMTIDPGVTFTLTSASTSRLTITNTGSTVNNEGTIDNAGTLTIFTGAKIVNSGTINNSVTIGSSTNPGTIENDCGGTINNTGTIHPTIVNTCADTSPPVITAVSDSPDPFSPNGDSVSDTTTISFTSDEPGTFTVQILDANLMGGQNITGTMMAGVNNVVWDGSGFSVATVPDGGYLYLIEADDVAGNRGHGGLPLGTHTIMVDTSGPPTAAGRITFSSERDSPIDGLDEIYVMNPDGTGVIRLTNNDDTDIEPSFSPDGSRIAFSSDRDGGAAEIYVMNSDGTGQTRLTTGGGGLAKWSPDGSKIVFQDGEIYSMNADGSGLLQLTSGGVDVECPSFSPDGSKIVFGRTMGGNLEIYSMNADGTGLVRITTNSAYDSCPSFSPDGSKIVFDTDRDGDIEIYVMNADGTGQTRLTYNDANDSYPSFSPDGTAIAFVSNRDGNREIYVMNADGTGQTRLTTTSNLVSDMYPNFGPEATSPASTTLLLDPISDVTATTGFTVSGTLSNTNTGEPITSKLITFTGSGVTPSLQAVTTDGVDFIGDINLISCPTPANPGAGDCVPDELSTLDADGTDNIVLHLGVGGKIVFPEGTIGAKLWIQNMGNTPFKYTVQEGNGVVQAEAESGGSESIIPVVNIISGFSDVGGNFVQNGLEEITITEVGGSSSSGSVGIAAILTTNPDGLPAEQHQINFEEFTDGSKPSPFTVNAGHFYSVGFAQNVESNGPLAVTAHFDGDALFLSDDSNTEEYNVIFNTRGTQGEGAQVTSNNVGGSITIGSCATDADNDGICKTWEETGLVSGVPGIAGGYAIPFTSDSRKDIYVEIDCMLQDTSGNYCPTAADLTAVTTAFSRENIDLHISLTGADINIPFNNPFHIWSAADGDNNLRNDFENIKLDFFGTPTERSQGTAGTLRSGKDLLELKAQIYHYGVFVKNINSGINTACGPSGQAELYGNDFVVSLGCGFSGAKGSVQEIQGTLMHELGHNLGLKHGGLDDDNCKPNHISVMNYARQLPWTQLGATNSGTTVNWALTYSREDLDNLSRLDENSVKESAGLSVTAGQWSGTLPAGYQFKLIWGQPPSVRTGVTGASVNWDNDGNLAESVVFAQDLNKIAGMAGCAPGTTILGPLESYDEFANLDLKFRDGANMDGLVFPDPDTVSELTPEVLEGVTSTILTLEPIADVSAGGQITATGLLTDLSGNPLANEMITFSGTGAENLLTVTTDVDGIYTSSGNAPAAVATGWEVEAHFAGTEDNSPANSSVELYDTLDSDNSPPTITSTTPADGDTDIGLDVIISAEFSEAMNDATITTSTFTLEGPSGPITGTVAYDPDTKTATFDPASDLAQSTEYTATLSSTIEDSAGNTMGTDYVWSFTTESAGLRIEGFYSPVDMEDSSGNPIVNTIKAGRSVPLKFEVFDNSNVEQTSTSVILSFTQNKINCATLQGETADPVEVTNTGGTGLRYDTVQGLFVQNWKTPSQAGSCYIVTLTPIDGSPISAFFRLLK